VEVRDSLAAFDDPDRLKALSLIVPLWTMGTIEKPQAENLIEAVKSGVGLAGFHGGMGDAFRGNIGYQWMVGGQFLAHPDGIKDYVVNIVRADDPIVAGMADFPVKSEQYYMLVDPRNEVLATTTHRSSSAPWTNGVVMPCIWKKRGSSIRRSATRRTNSPTCPSSSKSRCAACAGPRAERRVSARKTDCASFPGPAW
jgi:type 1 glutamine amidotransferase